ncbi:MAG TPA: TIM barrel protein [Candidatus Avipropionibacterium avicola]|uniref:TIM barrel protein n=1 Tax=Candidatus Avipropionibacterium avicola TaxID=2840701 RepID=A0A9D1GYC9_9ACTN|nr:TIM barrel protein [Candidatus Avipropionibacterium avicola]
MPGHGVILPRHQEELALSLGADYVEPPVVGNVIIADHDGDWQLAAADEPARRAPAFAVLVPKDFPLSDPAVPISTVRRYFDQALTAIATVAEPDAAVVLGSGRSRSLPEGCDPDRARDRFAESLVTARDAAERRGLRIVLEPLNRNETNLLTTIEEAATFLDGYGIERVSIVADLFHVMSEAEPLATVAERAGRIGHAHIADSGRVPPGQGGWPLREFLTALRSGGYRGPVSIECNWRDVATELAEALATVRAADPAVD